MAKSAKNEKSEEGTKRQKKQPSEPKTSPAPVPVHLCDDCLYDRDTCETEPENVIEGGVVECSGFRSATTPQPEPKLREGETPESVAGPPAQAGAVWVIVTLKDATYTFVEGSDRARAIDQEEADKISGQFLAGELEGVSELKQTDDPMALRGIVILTPGAPEGEQPPQVPIGAKPEEDLGACSCGWNYHRTAFNKANDAVRCINPRCPYYRLVIRKIPPLSLSERLELSRARKVK